jgi:type I restriction enzyme S subunit
MSLNVSVSEIVEKSKNPLLAKHEKWGRVLLGDIAIIQNGFAFASARFSKDGDMPLIRIRDVGKEVTDAKYSGEYDETYVVSPGDLLVGMDGDFNCARWRGPRGLLNQRVCRITLTADMYHPKLLDYALPGYLKAINDNTSSVTVKHLSSKSICEIPLPLPPMEQQKLIVAEIEKQFSRLDEAVAGLKRVKANLKRYKASVLKAAVEGKLTEEWRKAHSTVESGAELLKRILAERKKKWEEKNPGKIYKEPVAPDTSNRPELPEGWVWASLEQLTSQISDVDHKMPKAAENGIPYISTKDFTGDDDINFAGAKRISVADFDSLCKKVQPLRDDILLSRYGTVGAVRVVATNLPFQASYSIAILKPVMKEEITVFIADCLKSDFVQQQIKRDVRATAQPDLGLAHIRQFILPVPTLKEQCHIIAEVDRRLSVLQEVEEEVDTSLQRAERLRQGILKKAFRGELNAYRTSKWWSNT